MVTVVKLCERTVLLKLCERTVWLMPSGRGGCRLVGSVS